MTADSADGYGVAVSNIYLLHIGKTGGTALKHALTPIAHERGLVLCRHTETLKDVPAGSRAIFCVRDPISRFVSGFNSRLRQGMPRRFNPWRPEEQQAFALFPTPNSLAEALSGPLRSEAVRAMNAIRHVRDHLSKWVISADYLHEREDDIFLVCAQEHLNQDFAVLASALPLPRSPCRTTTWRRTVLPRD